MVIGFVLLLPVLIPYALVLVAVENRRKRRAAALFVCVKCGKVLGLEAIRISDEEERKSAQERAGDVMWRTVRTCHAICPSCGARYFFSDRARDV